MAAPDAGVYAEIIAPDLRFAFALALVGVWVALYRRAMWRLSPTLVLLGFTSLAFVSWLATSGNGRYFIPILLVVGPLCVALAHQMPWSCWMRLSIVFLMVGLQGIAIYEASPFQTWALHKWAEPPFFDINLDDEMRSVPSTYVTITSISYSLIAPKFPEASRWINLSTQHGDPTQTKEGRHIQSMLAEANTLHLIVPSRPSQITTKGLPNEAVTRAVNRALANQRLAILEPELCRFVRSGGLATLPGVRSKTIDPEMIPRVGFWICPLRYPVENSTPEQAVTSLDVEHAFEAVERACPRFFQPGTAMTSRFNEGYLRMYHGSDMRVFVMDTGEVMYKYWRAMNPETIGTISQVLEKNFTMDCNNLRGRSGLPWERNI